MASESAGSSLEPSSTIEMARATARRSPARTFWASPDGSTFRRVPAADRAELSLPALGCPYPLGHGLHEPFGDYRLPLHDHVHRPRVQDHHAHVGSGSDRGGPGGRVEEGQLPEEVP